MPGLLARFRDRLSPRRFTERRQVAALARQLGVSPADATRILRRSREVGFGAAMLEEEGAGPGAAPDDA